MPELTSETVANIGQIAGVMSLCLSAMLASVYLAKLLGIDVT